MARREVQRRDSHKHRNNILCSTRGDYYPTKRLLNCEGLYSMTTSYKHSNACICRLKVPLGLHAHSVRHKACDVVLRTWHNTLNRNAANNKWILISPPSVLFSSYHYACTLLNAWIIKNCGIAVWILMRLCWQVCWQRRSSADDTQIILLSSTAEWGPCSFCFIILPQ
jgi:hypothetical protein